MATESALRLDQWLAVSLFSVVLLLQGIVQPVPTEFLNLTVVPQIPMADMPVSNSTDTAQKSPSLTAEAFIVVDAVSASLLVEGNADKALYPASTTKLVTALLAAEAFNPDETWQLQPGEIVEYSTTGLRSGDELQVRSLMAALLIESDNAAAELFAHRYPGGRQAFISAMQRYAQQKHLTHTQFVNPAGFDDPLQQLSATDLAILAREVMRVPWLLELTAVPQTKISLKRQGQPIELSLINTNKLLNSPLGIKGIKTGTTPAAGEVLVTLVENNTHPLLVVVMGSQDRFSDTRQLIQWVQTTYSWRSIH